MSWLANSLKSLFKISLNRVSPKVAEWFSKTLYNVAEWFLNSFKKYFDKLFPFLAGGSGVALAGFSLKDVFDKSQDKLNFLSRLLQLDDLFDSINNSFFVDGKLSAVCDSSFTEIMGALGIISAINEIVNALGILVIWALVFYVVRIFAGIAGSLVSVAITKF